MARKTIFVSDLTGKTIDEQDAATVTIKYADAREGRSRSMSTPAKSPI
jgi:hypothetical protein